VSFGYQILVFLSNKSLGMVQELLLALFSAVFLPVWLAGGGGKSIFRPVIAKILLKFLEVSTLTFL
jgi:hypothetical protein